MDERRRLDRARLIERVRTMDKSRAARASADAEAVSGRLRGVADKTRLLASHYAMADGLQCADDLRRRQAMQAQLRKLAALNADHLRDAQRRADAALTELGSAERRRARVEADRRELARTIEEKASR
jgi:hypothetical protein